MSWDDDKNVYENPYLNPVGYSNTLRFWKEPYENLYIPLTYTVWAMEARLSRLSITKENWNKLNAKVFHLGNLLLHLMSVLALYFLTRALLSCYLKSQSAGLETVDPQNRDWAAACGAALFALHPVQVEPVAWISGMKDLLSGFLSLSALLLYIKYARSEAESSKSEEKAKLFLHLQNRNYLAATALYLLALLSKPTAVVLPAAAFLLGRFILKRPGKKSAAPAVVWALLAIPAVVAANLSQPELTNEYIPPLWARPLIAGDALAFYLYNTNRSG